MRNETLFFEAWRDAICISGMKSFFGPATPETAKSKNDLRPDTLRIERKIGVLSPSEQEFLLAMHSFYNSVNTAKIVKQLNMEASFNGLVSRLDDARKEIIFKLWLYYPGW